MKPLKLTLQDLGAARQALRQQAARRAQELQAQREQAQAAAREADLFARTVGPVVPLSPANRVPPWRHTPLPQPRQRERDEADALRQALSDGFDVDTLLETDEGLSYRREGIGEEVLRRLRQGHWALQAQIDLHGLRRDGAREALGQFIQDCSQRGLRCVRVVHGKGHGSPGRVSVLKVQVRRWLVQKREVLAFVQARACDGGAGAVIVLLAGRSSG